MKTRPCLTLKNMTFIVAAAIMTGCKPSAGFSGGGRTKPEATKTASPVNRPRNPAPQVQPAENPSNSSDSLSYSGEASESSYVAPPPAPVFPQTPPEAVVKGSFIVWVDPPNPKPYEEYQVIILVKLPTGFQSYTRQDISGKLEGSDGYYQVINGGQGNYTTPKVDLGRPRQNFYFTPGSGYAKFSMIVPGAYKGGVNDTIYVSARTSQAGRDHQTINVRFR